MEPDHSEMSRCAASTRAVTPPRARVAPGSNSLVSEGGFVVDFQDAQGSSFSLRVLESTTLRDMQQMLVGWLGLSFPQYSATLLKQDGKDGNKFWDFNSEPFKDATTGDAYLVNGEITGDMYFVDKIFRSTSESKT